MDLLSNSWREDLDTLLEQVVSGAHITSDEFLPYLCLERKEERIIANTKMAEAYVKIKNFEQARIFINRSWIMSEFSAEIQPLYIQICDALHDYNAIKEAYKRVGMRLAKQNRIGLALAYFFNSFMAVGRHTKTDSYEYDFDILDRIEQLAVPYRFTEYPWQVNLAERKIRLAYLAFGATHLNSTTMKILRNLVEYHESSKFEIAVFISDTQSQIDASPEGNEHIAFLRRCGCQVIVGEWQDAKTIHLHLNWLASQIYNFKPDLLVFSAMLADLHHYYIASLYPAPVMIGQVSGPPSQFSAHCLNATIAWSAAAAMESMSDSYKVKLENKYTLQKNKNVYPRSNFAIPDDGIILMLAGRYSKFQNAEIWKAILEVMVSNKKIYLITMGVAGHEPDFLENMLNADLKKRITFLEFRKDYLSIVGMADVMIDTYPSGGGLVLEDAMSFKIPVVSFEHNYFVPFNQATSWSVMGEFASEGRFDSEILDLIVPRDDFKQFKEVLIKLIDDEIYRKKCGEAYYSYICTTTNSPAHMTRCCEEIYINVINTNEKI
jgi:predicted O-linked N-acetylglucosamine transferase (SPINDLY family)